MKTINNILKVLIIFLILGCVQDTHLKNIIFKLDMNGIENPSKVGVRGSFTDNPWNETIPLTDEDGDGIFEGRFSQKTAINQIQFKFVKDNADYELRGSDNRIIEFEYRPETIVYEATFNNPNASVTKQ